VCLTWRVPATRSAGFSIDGVPRLEPACSLPDVLPR
jgi:hypothetical protein